MRRVVRWLAWGVAGGTGVVLAAGVAGWFLLDRFDLSGIAARRATAALGRPVSFAAVHVTPGKWLLLTVQDAQLANAADGTRPEMAKIGRVSAELEAWPLLHGSVVLRNVAVEGLDLLLEHGPGGVPNWRFGPEAPKPTGPPAREGSFPTLFTAAVSGRIMLRTSSGSDLPIGLDGVTFSTAGVDQPSRLAGAGSYNGVPLKLDSRLGSIAQYRDAATPFPTVIQLESGTTHLRFEGTMADPINVDGARGELRLEASNLGVLSRVSGLETELNPAIKLQGGMLHDRSTWELSQIQGALGQAGIYGGTLRLEEGGRANDAAPLAPDRVGVAVQFEQLDLDALLGGQGKPGGKPGGKQGGNDMSLSVERAPQTLIAAKLRARGLTYGGVKVTNVELDASQTAGQVAVEALSLGYLGGTVEAQGRIDAVAGGGAVSAEVRVAALEVQALRALLDLGRLPVTGRMDGRAVVTATGETLNQALRVARGSAVVTMAGGAVSKQIVQLGSTDVRALFGTSSEMVGLSCLLGLVEVRSGIGTIGPVRIRSAEGTIDAHGTVDMARRRVDLTVASEPRTTGFLALDVPVRVSGPFTDLSFEPARLSAAGRAQMAAIDQVGRLPPALQGVARGSPCLAR